MLSKYHQTRQATKKSLRLTISVLLVIAASGASFAVEKTERPFIFWKSEPVQADETVVIVGENLPTDQVSIKVSGIGRKHEANAAEASIAATILQSSRTSLKFVLPSGISTGIYKVTLTGEGRTVYFTLNSPTVWWSQGEYGTGAASGGWLRIFGKSLKQPLGSTKLKLGTQGRQIVLNSTSANQWTAEFALPDDLPTGTYSARVGSELEEDEAWSTPFEVTITARASVSSKKETINVLGFGARGDGTTDDTKAILDALSIAGSRGGGTVFIPQGRFRITGTIEVPHGVTLSGQGMDASTLFWDNFKNPPDSLIHGNGAFSIEKMSLYAANYVNVLTNSAPEAIGITEGIVIDQLRIRANRYRGHLTEQEVASNLKEALARSRDGGDGIALTGRNITIRECDIYVSGRPLFLNRVRGALVEKNVMYTGRWGWYSISGADGVIFEANTITGADLMSSGGGLNSLYGNSFSKNIWYAGNRISLLHGWDREAMTSDGGGGFYYGRVVADSAKTIKLLDPHPSTTHAWNGAAVFVLGGKGAGQYRAIVKVESDRLILESPWLVAPDESSRVSITALQTHYLIISNTFTDIGPAVQFYGTSIENVVAHNTSARAGSMISWGHWYRHYQPSWYNMFLENEFLDGLDYWIDPNKTAHGDEAVLSIRGVQRPPNHFPLSLANILRGNILRRNALIEIRGSDPANPGIKDAIVEKNIVENSSVGIKVDAGLIDVLIRGNTLKNIRSAPSLRTQKGLMYIE